MKKDGRLWAPWRLAYLRSARADKPDTPGGCLFCRTGRSRRDAQNHVLVRGRLSFSLLNRYPYNNGHLMIAPYRHVGRLDRLRPEEWAELGQMLQEMLRRAERVFSPDGFNVGLNLGRVAGAGVPGHLHLHAVPRWSGDTNFMPVLAGTKVISQSLDDAYRRLKRV